MPPGVGRAPDAGVTGEARLVGDGVENPANARALLDAAAMFGIPCLFRDTRGLEALWDTDRGGLLPLVDPHNPIESLAPLVAVENVTGAVPVYDAPKPRRGSSIVVGNERLGIRGDLLRVADQCVQIPTASRGVNTLNVASAAAVALFYLLATDRRPTRQSPQPVRRRPAVLLAAPTDHVEVGSAIRTAAAFGWRSVGLDDRHSVWFGVSRAARTEGRAAARTHRNATRVLPLRAEGSLGFKRIVLAGTRVDGRPILEVDLAGGRDTLLVIPDEDGIGEGEWGSLGGRMDFARVELPVSTFPYRYRLVASIVLAEAARQIGRPAALGRPAPRRGLTYQSTLEVAAAGGGEVVSPSELRDY
jgi:tRNA G18 (ribose-2'-O)-methylase SpoU